MTTMRMTKCYGDKNAQYFCDMMLMFFYLPPLLAPLSVEAVPLAIIYPPELSKLKTQWTNIIIVIVNTVVIDIEPVWNPNLDVSSSEVEVKIDMARVEFNAKEMTTLQIIKCYALVF